MCLSVVLVCTYLCLIYAFYVYTCICVIHMSYVYMWYMLCILYDDTSWFLFYFITILYNSIVVSVSEWGLPYCNESYIYIPIIYIHLYYMWLCCICTLMLCKLLVYYSPINVLQAPIWSRPSQGSCRSSTAPRALTGRAGRRCSSRAWRSGLSNIMCLTCLWRHVYCSWVLPYYHIYSLYIYPISILNYTNIYI